MSTTGRFSSMFQARILVLLLLTSPPACGPAGNDGQDPSPDLASEDLLDVPAMPDLPSSSEVWDIPEFQLDAGGGTLISSTEIRLSAGDMSLDIPLVIHVPEAGEIAAVVILTHGFLGNPEQLTSYGHQLASWGIGVVMPQLPGSLTDPVTHRQYAQLLNGLIEKLDLGMLPGLEQAAGLPLGLAGHSMGGKLSLLTASMNPRVAAVVGLDPVDSGGGPGQPPTEDYPSVTPELMAKIPIPLMLLGETGNGQGELACAPLSENFQQYHLAATGPSIAVEVLGANHMSFIDNPDCGLPCLLCPKGTDDPAVTNALARKYLTMFFLGHLLDRGDLLRAIPEHELPGDEALGLVTWDGRDL